VVRRRHRHQAPARAPRGEIVEDEGEGGIALATFLAAKKFI